MISIDNDLLTVHFQRFGIEEYDLFLRCKQLPESTVEYVREDETYKITAPARFAGLLGVKRRKKKAEALPIADFLFDDQVELVRMALEAKRFALWSQCGNGKTPCGLEFSRQVAHRTKSRVLIVTLPDIVQQWIDECAKFYPAEMLRLHRIQSRDEMREWCEKGGGESDIAITNYEKFNPGKLEDQVVNECRHLGGIILDENRLKGGGAKQKWALIKSCKGIEYKLSLTATPAPNDTIEFASQASFLEKMRTDADIIWTYFTRDPVSHRWQVKPHARQAFFEFMSSWSIYVNNPKHYGWRASLPDIPDPEYITVPIEPTAEQMRIVQQVSAAASSTGQAELYMDQTNAIQRGKLSQVAKGFRYRRAIPAVEGAPKKGRIIEHIESLKPDVVADIVRKEVAAGAQVLVWTVFDEETAILERKLDGLAGLDVLTGGTGKADRLDILNRFRDGTTRCLISRAKMLGYGMNFQCCTAMVYSGWTDSFEALYQSIRRAVRYGQTERVRVYFPVIEELEGDTLSNIMRKQAEFLRSIDEMEANFLKARRKLK